MDTLKIPLSYEPRCSKYAAIPNIITFSNNLSKQLLNVKNAIKYDLNAKNTVEVMLIDICRQSW